MKYYLYNAKGFFVEMVESETQPPSSTEIPTLEVRLRPGECLHFNGGVWSVVENEDFSGNTVVSKELKAAKIVADAQKAIDALLAPKANVQHLMEATYDTWVLLEAIKTHLGLTDSNLGTAGAAAHTRLLSRQSMYAAIQAIRVQRDIDLGGL